MGRRYASIWFRYLKTDWFAHREPRLQTIPFVLATPVHGRMVITAANILAQKEGIHEGMVVADARAIISSLEVINDIEDLAEKLLTRIAKWSIRFTPVVSIDFPNGLIMDITGCAHLWNGEISYLDNIKTRFKKLGFYTRISIADTIGAAWAIARFGNEKTIIESGQQKNAILKLPPSSLRIEPETTERLHKLGLNQVNQFINLPRHALLRRFGQSFLSRIDQSIGFEEEFIQPVEPVTIYQERLPCLEAIVTATGIEIALRQLLEILCDRLRKEEKGIRSCIFKGFRVDGKIEKIEIGTNYPSSQVKHLFKLFEIKISTIEPALGIELFILEAPKVESISSYQEKLWENNQGMDERGLSELMDRLAGKIGADKINRYLPAEHYWPERSIQPAISLRDKPTSNWKLDRPRPLQLLPRPEPIEVTAPIPDYPPMLFRHKGKLHKISRADGPERIEQEWWIQEGEHRDYYHVEDEEGHRYWLFRSGHYTGQRTQQWFLHGFFA